MVCRCAACKSAKLKFAALAQLRQLVIWLSRGVGRFELFLPCLRPFRWCSWGVNDRFLEAHRTLVLQCLWAFLAGWRRSEHDAPEGGWAAIRHGGASESIFFGSQAVAMPAIIASLMAYWNRLGVGPGHQDGGNESDKTCSPTRSCSA